MIQIRFAWIACAALTIVVVGAVVSYPGSAIEPLRSISELNFQDTTIASLVQAPSVPNASSENEYIQLVSFTSDPVQEKAEANQWPSPKQLIKQIEALNTVPEIKHWNEQTIALLSELSELSGDSRELGRCLHRLEVQAQSLSVVATNLWQRVSQSPNQRELLSQQCEVSRLAYRLSRRIAVWNSLRVSGNSKSVVQDSFSDSPNRSASFSRISFDHLDQTWVEYLELQDLKSAFDSFNPDPAEQKSACRKVLSRIYSPVLRTDQVQYINQIIDPEIIGFLRENASSDVAQDELLKRIENYENQCSGLSSYYLNDLYQSLLWSNDPADQAVAAELQTHYRNANFRFAVSQRLLNRLIPELPTTASPVSENIKGARVFGQSHVSNQLHVVFDPNPNQIVLKLATVGNVQSDTIARTNTFRIQNLGRAEFQVVKPIIISPRGIDTSARAYSHTTGNQSVVGLQSKLDDIPIVGWMARRLAEKKLQDDSPETDRMFQQTVNTSAESQMQQKVEQEIAKLRQMTYANLYQPLIALELEPEALQMSTTSQQMVMRYRLAGRDQMAAHTSRPRDDGNSLLCFQLHESAINNAIARLGLNDQKFTTGELTAHLRDVLGTPQVENQDQNDRQAEMHFAPLDPIHVGFQDDRMVITLNLKSFKVGENGKEWKNISMTAAYKTVVNGMQIYLQQDDDGTRIKGRRLKLRDQAAISTVMKVLFKKEYSINSLPAKFYNRIGGQMLEISQLVVSDGWLAVSVDDQQSRFMSSQPATDGSRIGAIRRLMNRR